MLTWNLNKLPNLINFFPIPLFSVYLFCILMPDVFSIYLDNISRFVSDKLLHICQFVGYKFPFNAYSISFIRDRGVEHYKKGRCFIQIYNYIVTFSCTFSYLTGIQTNSINRPQKPIYGAFTMVFLV
jgi:hypothetical protein